MQGWLRQSTSVDVPIGPFVDQTDGFTAETGLTLTQPDIRLKKNNANWIQKNAAQTLTHEENGYYEVTLDATDTNTLGLLRVAVNEAGALPVWSDWLVVPAAVFDAVVNGTGNGVRSDVQAIAANVVNASALATDAVDEIVDQVWNEDATAHQTQGTFGQAIGDPIADSSTIWDLANTNLDAAISTRASAAALATAQTDLDDIQARLPAALIGGRIDADVGAISGDATAADNLELEFDGTGYKSYTRRGTAQGGAAASITLDTGASAIDDFYNNSIVAIMSGQGAGQARFVADYVGATRVVSISPNWVTNPNATSVFVVLPFASIPGATAPTAAEVADAVWDEDATAHQTTGTFGQAIGDPGADTDTIWALVNANVDATISSRATGAQATAIQADTDDIQARLPAALVGGRMSSDVIAISGDTTAADNLETAYDETAGQVPWSGIIDQGTAQAATANTIRLRAAANFVNDEIIGATVVVTGGSGGVGQARAIIDYDATTDTATVDPWITTPSGTITYKVFATPPASSVSPMPSNIVQIAGAAVNVNTAQIGVNTVQVSGDGTAADNLESEYDGTGFKSYTRRGTAQAGAATSITLDAGANASNDYYNNSIVAIIAGAGAGQARFIEDYTGSTRLAAISPNWIANPDGTSVFVILPFNAIPGASAPTASQVADAVWNRDATGHQTQGTFGQVIGDSGADSDSLWALVNANLDTAVSSRASAANLTTALNDLDDIQSRLPTVLIGGRISADVGSISGDVAAADNMEAEFDNSGYKSYTRRATAQGGTAGTITLDAGASTSDDYYNNSIVAIMAGVGAGQARFIGDYVGATRIVSVSPNWVITPDATSVFVVMPFSSIPGATAPTAAEVADAVWDEDATGHQTQGTFGQAIGDPGASASTIYNLAAVNLNATVSSRATQTSLDAVQADTDNIQTRLPAALVSGRMDASVGAMAAGVVTAAAVATDAIDADALAANAVTEIQSGLATAAAVAALNNLSAAQVNAEVVDAINVDTYAEPGVGAPPATTSLVGKVNYLYKRWRNRTTQSASLYRLYNDDGTTVGQQATTSDDTTTFDRTEIVSG